VRYAAEVGVLVDRLLFVRLFIAEFTLLVATPLLTLPLPNDSNFQFASVSLFISAACATQLVRRFTLAHSDPSCTSLLPLLRRPRSPSDPEARLLPSSRLSQQVELRDEIEQLHAIKVSVPGRVCVRLRLHRSR